MGAIHTDLSFADYRKLEGLNASSMKEGFRSMGHMRAAMDGPGFRTPALDFGTLVHTCVLEPSKVEEEYQLVVKKPRRGTLEWKKAMEDGRILVSYEEMDKVGFMVEQIQSHPVASYLLDPHIGTAELSIQWETMGVLCKARIDKWTGDHLVDLKTTTNASAEDFARSAGRWGYYRQMAFYGDGLAAVQDRTDPPPHTIVAVEKEPPYGVQCFTIPEHTLRRGRIEYQMILRKYKECLDSGSWPLYPDGTTELNGIRTVDLELEFERN